MGSAERQKLPQSAEDILATGAISSEFAAALKKSPIPPLSGSIEQLKRFGDASLPRMQAQLQDSRPANITESEHMITLQDESQTSAAHQIRIVICSKSDALPDTKSPLVVIFHGGGHCIGHPESEVPLARRLALEHNACVILPAYRLAPEHPFPASITDAWSTMQYLVREAVGPSNAETPLLPPNVDLSCGFIAGGTSAGANLAAVIAHLARDKGLSPPLTGQFLCAGTYMSPQHVPANYRSMYLSREQNRDAPILSEQLADLFHSAFKPDLTSPLWASFDQHHPADEGTGSVKNGHLGLPPAYFQICGMDISRDDGLIYEKVLREECDVPTRADLYAGWAHCWWSVRPRLPSAKRRENDAVEGIGWLLKSGSSSL